MPKAYRLAILSSHPIQYFAPLYRRLAATEDIDLTVFFCSRQGLEGGHVDPGFGQVVVWDIPLLEGYRWKFLPNLWRDHGVKGPMSLFNLSVLKELYQRHFDAFWIHGHNSGTNLLPLLCTRILGTPAFI